MRLIAIRRLHDDRFLAPIQTYGMFSAVAELDESQEAVRNVDRITESEPVKGEELVESEDLKRQFREAKERLRQPVGE
jgi:hypothetical protein